MADGIVDWVEEKAKEAVALPGQLIGKAEDAAVNEAKKLFQSVVVDPLETKANQAFGGNIFGSKDTSGIPSQDGGPQGSPRQDNGGLLGNLFSGLTGSTQATGGDGAPSSDGDSSFGFLGKIGGFVKSFLSHPLDTLLGLLVMAIAGAMGLLDGLGSLFGGGGDDVPGASVTQRIGNAFKSVENTFEANKNDSIPQAFKNAANKVSNTAHVLTETVEKDYSNVTVGAKDLYAVGYLSAHGVPLDVAKGMAANFKAESGFNADAYGHGAEARGLSGEAYGIGQWHKDRQAEFAKFKGYDIHGSSLNDQLDFAVYELKHREHVAGEKLMTAQSPEHAAQICCEYYERAGNQPKQDAVRMHIANEISVAYDRQQQNGVEVASSSAPLPTAQMGNVSMLRNIPSLGG